MLQLATFRMWVDVGGANIRIAVRNHRALKTCIWGHKNRMWVDVRGVAVVSSRCWVWLGWVDV